MSWFDVKIIAAFWLVRSTGIGKCRACLAPEISQSPRSHGLKWAGGVCDRNETKGSWLRLDRAVDGERPHVLRAFKGTGVQALALAPAAVDFFESLSRAARPPAPAGCAVTS